MAQEKLNGNIFSYNSNNSSILTTIKVPNVCTTDTNEISDEFLVCPNLKQLFVQCSKCDSVYDVSMDCKRRDCEVCQKKRAVKLFRKYKDRIALWENTEDKKIQFLTLTFKNVKDLELVQKNTYDRNGELKIVVQSNYIKRRDRDLKAFLKRWTREVKATKFRKGRKPKVFDYGFVCKEMTYHALGEPKFDSETKKIIGYYTERDYGYHYHYHILFYGDKFEWKSKNLDEDLSTVWKDVTEDSFYIKLYNKFENASHSLRYMLKYVTKPLMETGKLSDYYKAMRRQRFFQPFGKKYKAEKKLKVPFVCSNCGSEFEKKAFDKPFFTIKPENVEIKKLNFNRLRMYAKMIQYTKNQSNVKYASFNFKQDKQNVKIEVLQKYNPDNVRKSINEGVNHYDDLVLLYGKEYVDWCRFSGHIFEFKPNFYEVAK